eukprot:11119796-Alexandrium_andersonii.AAC.1
MCACVLGWRCPLPPSCAAPLVWEQRVGPAPPRAPSAQQATARERRGLARRPAAQRQPLLACAPP